MITSVSHSSQYRFVWGFALTMAFLCFGGEPQTAVAQSRLTKKNYISPTARGVRPRHHKPVLPAPVVSMHGLSSFPIGGSENLAHPIQAGPGFRISGAWQSSEQIATELSYRASTHETTTGLHNERGFFQSIHLGAILYPLETTQTFRPFFSVGTHGLGFFSERLTAHKMMGFGVDFGGGVGVFLSRHTSITIGLRYLGTFVYEAEESFFGSLADSSTFVSQISPEMGLVFYP